MRKVRFWLLDIWLLGIICNLVFGICNLQYLYAQEKIVAIVNNDAITQKDLNDFVNFMRIQLAQEYSAQDLDKKIESMRADLLDRLIEDRLILQEANKSGVKADESRVKAKIEEIKKRYRSEAEFQDSLGRQGLVQADLETKIRDQLSMYSIIDSKIRKKIVVNPKEVTDYYQKNLEKFNIPEQREIESVCTEDQQLAQDLANSAKEEKSLAQLAKSSNLEVNKISVHKGEELRKETEGVVFGLNLGELSSPVKIDNKYYIFKVDSIIPSRQESLSDARDAIYSMLFNKKMQGEMVKWLDELKKNSYVKICQEDECQIPKSQ